MKLISQTDAAALRGVSRQAINKLSRRVWKFFQRDQTGEDCVDIEHEHWKLYMEGRKPAKPTVKRVEAGQTGGSAGGVDGAKPARKRGPGGGAGRKGSRKGAGKPGAGGKRGKAGRKAKPALDIDKNLKAFIPTSLRELKTYTEVQRINVEIQARLGELMDRAIITTRLQEMGQMIQMFVDLDARVAGRICQKLDRIGMEKEVQKIIAPEVKKIIQDFKEKCSRKL